MLRWHGLAFVGGLTVAWNGPDPGLATDPFRPLDDLLPTPSETRTASGAPGHRYWQQQVDYRIEVELDESNHRIRGSEHVRYHNESPDALRYLWLQLDANIYSPTSESTLTAASPVFERLPYRTLQVLLDSETFDGSVTLTRVEDGRGRKLSYAVDGTMLRIDLPKPLLPGRNYEFEIDWSYTVNEASSVPGRTGYERLADGTVIYEIAQWFPRLVAYYDAQGWQHQPFLGRGEFTLEFGNYDVAITVPADHVVAATGELRNARDTLRPTERERLERARAANEPVFIVTPAEAKAAATGRSNAKRTWRFTANRVRDFAFASSRKFIWDAVGHEVGSQTVLAMSFYPPEAEPLWSRYSTRAITHALDVYSRYTFPYPYPVAISVNGPVPGMEYPMISFNGPRPEPDGTYSERIKYGLISVVIHEVGHNYFPMVVNNDERCWMWMDEGLNAFLQYRAEQEWEADYPSRRSEPRDIAEFMRSADDRPIMTTSDSLSQLGNSAYGKTATALNILRETVLGRERFDDAFAEYARRWQFKRPTPADFFRSIEDASGVDLDWFWRGWFYSVDHVDLAIASVGEFVLETGNPDTDKPRARAERDAAPESLSHRRDVALPKLVDRLPSLKDFYNDWDPLDVTADDRRRYQDRVAKLDPKEQALLDTRSQFFAIELENRGGLVMPVILQITFASGAQQELRIPATIWRYDAARVTKLVLAKEPIVAVVLDPHLETADTDLANNHWPPKPTKTRFQLLEEPNQKNPMQTIERKPSPATPPAAVR